VLATSSAAVIGAALAAAGAAPAFAQDEEADASERVVVTGSRIQRQDYTANSPIVTVGEETFENTSTIGIETVLNQLPQFVPALTQFSGAQSVESSATNTPGASTVNLRGLGSQRSLTLIDGRRGMPVNATMSVDTNSIPSSAIQRVEIISGGASAVYGADAVGGVVNFILKDDYEGVDVDVRYGLTEIGDGEEFSISALLGANVADGRGNVMVGLEHSTRSDAFAADRDWRRDELESPWIAPSEFWFSETYYAPSSDDLGARPSQAAINALFPGQATCFNPNGTACTPITALNGSFFINPTPDGTGTLFTGGQNFFSGVPQGGASDYTGPFESPEFPGLPWRKRLADGSIGENQLANFNSFPLERYSLFAKGEFEVAPNVDAYVQGNFAKTITDTLLQYSPANNGWQVTVPYGADIYAPSVGAGGATLPAYLPGGVYGLNCPATGGCTQSQAFPLPAELQFLLNSRTSTLADGTVVSAANRDVSLNRNLDFLDRRRTENRSTTYNVIAGLEGSLPNDWVWDVSMSHGESETVASMFGFASLQRYRAVASSPNFGRGFFTQGNAAEGGFASGSGTCTSGLPLVQEFQVSQDCINAIAANMQNNSIMQQNVAEANLAGDLFDLPAGPFSFAVGANYRENTYRFQTDILTDINSFGDQAIGLFAAGSSQGAIDVGEVYGELLVPIVEGLPFIEQLNVELGGRYSDYSSVGGVTTYKALLDWTIVDWARLRGGYNRATRAPNIGELFLARTQQAFGTPAQFGDPCSQNNDTNPFGASPLGNTGGAAAAAQVVQICRDLMGPTGASSYYDSRAIADQPNDNGGVVGSPYTRGNPDVGPETADTWTAGLVLSSPFENRLISGLTATIDFYQIKLKDMIASQGPDAIYQQCMVSGDAASAACDLVIRDPITGNGSSVDLTYTNEGKATFSGIDVSLNWSAQFEDLGVNFIPGGLSINTQATFPIERETQVNENLDPVDWVGTSGCALALQCSGYEYQFFTTFNYFTGPFSASLRWNHYPSIDPGSLATNPASRARGTASYNVFALTGSYQVTDTLTFRAGVENLLDNDPPLSGGSFHEDGGWTTNDNVMPRFPTLPTHSTGIADPLGRRYFVGLNASF
jgi:outer membrane receptor protein involved in Fe transport